MTLPFRDFEGSPPVWFALAPVFWVVSRLPGRRGALLCAAGFALAWTGASFTFIWPLTPPGMAALCIYTSLYYVAALMWVRILARRSVICGVFGTAALWALVEIVRSVVPVFGFPWLLMGHALLYNERLRQGADLLGVYGLSFIVVAVNAALAFSLPVWLQNRLPATVEEGKQLDRGKFPLAGVFVLILGLLAYGQVRIEQLSPRLRPGPRIGIIQGNIIQKLRRSKAELTAQLIRHLELHRRVIDLSIKEYLQQRPAMVCWAETMVPGSVNIDSDWSRTFREAVAERGVPTLAGSNFNIPAGPEKGDEPQCFNTAYYFNADGSEVFHYFKRRLVPFGEYIPFVHTFPFLKVLRSVTRDQYTPGSTPSAIRNMGGYHGALSICVEDIHPDLAREAALAGADSLFNLTNDGWFYGTCGPKAHLRAAAWRAIEVRRPLLRVTNTGCTVAVNPLGKIDMLLPEGNEYTTCTNLQMIGTNDICTMYTCFGNGGVAMLFLALLFAVMKIEPVTSEA